MTTRSEKLYARYNYSAKKRIKKRGKKSNQKKNTWAF